MNVTTVPLVDPKVYEEILKMMMQSEDEPSPLPPSQPAMVNMSPLIKDLMQIGEKIRQT